MSAPPDGVGSSEYGEVVRWEGVKVSDEEEESLLGSAAGGFLTRLRYSERFI